MNLENQRVTGNNQVTINDSLNAALIELNLSLTESSVAPSSNDLYIYVDKQPKDSPSEERRQYLFELNDILKSIGETSDVFIQHLVVENNDICLKNIVERKISLDTETQETYILEESTLEEVEGFPIILFEGVNYIYTNYDNIDINLIYVKDSLENKAFLNGSMYHHHKLRNDGEFCLDDIYFKDAFTKTGDDLNIEVNNCCVESISSKNNKFSLDEEGNLVVNTISCNNLPTISLDENEVCSIAYPVGSVYVSATNSNPSELFGGEWELIDKEFSPYFSSKNEGFTASSNIVDPACYFMRGGHSISFEIQFDTSVKIQDTELQMGSYNLSTVGVNSLYCNYSFLLWGDEAQSIAMTKLTYDGKIKTSDQIPDGYIAASRWLEGTVTVTLRHTNMLDSACNKFYWKRTA